MKSLVESLFDKDLAKRNITFGNIFKHTETVSTLPKSARGWKASGRGWRQSSNKDDKYGLEDLYLYKEIEKKTKVSGDPHNIIINGIIKLINDIPITINTTNSEFENMLYDRIMKYYTSKATIDLKNKVYTPPYTRIHVTDKSTHRGNVILNIHGTDPKNILDDDIKNIDINLGGFYLVFEKK